MARSLLGCAATTGLRTLEQLTQHKDARIRLEAAQDLMERAGLGLSQRSTSTTSTAFAFAFGSPRKDEA
jgi:hypothetical protein